MDARGHDSRKGGVPIASKEAGFVVSLWRDEKQYISLCGVFSKEKRYDDEFTFNDSRRF